jgi:hypothetical protein
MSTSGPRRQTREDFIRSRSQIPLEQANEVFSRLISGELRPPVYRYRRAGDLVWVEVHQKQPSRVRE